MRYGRFVGASGEPVDQVLAVFMPAGRSYTGLDQAEIFCHGGDQAIRQLLGALLQSGARAAEPGEFTRLAFENGRIDLSQAEAVAEIVAASTEQSFRAAREHLMGSYSEHVAMLRNRLTAILAETEASVDFPEEDIEPDQTTDMLRALNELLNGLKELADTYQAGRIIKEGFTVAIAGRPNAGKSSLFNLLLQQERALVAAEPGTTRDYISEWIDLGGYAVRLIDTAGLRTGGDHLEQAGQERARRLMSDSDLILWLADISEPDWEPALKQDIMDLKKQANIVVYNKIDKVREGDTGNLGGTERPALRVSCTTSEGIDNLKAAILNTIREHASDLTSSLIVTSARHHQKLTAALERLQEAYRLLELGESPEIVSFELRSAANRLDEITGRIYTEDILEQVFAQFCIGK